MSSYIEYKFKINNILKRITFEGSGMSKLDLSNAIKLKEKLSALDYELQIFDTDGTEYINDRDMISRFSSVDVIRKPIKNRKRIPKTNKIEFPNEENQVTKCKTDVEKIQSSIVHSDMSNEAKIDLLVQCELQKIPPKTYTRQPLSKYVCHKCNVPGHYIESCPGIKDEYGNYVSRKDIKRPSGIPRTRLAKANPGDEGAYMDDSGHYVRSTNIVHKIKHKPAFSKEENPPVQPKVEKVIPAEFKCNLCKNILTNPLQTPCCFVNYCATCILDELFNPDVNGSQLCPNCKKQIPLVDDLIENDELSQQIIQWQTKGTSENDSDCPKPSKVANVSTEIVKQNVSKTFSNSLPTCREEPEEEDAGDERNKLNDQRTDYSNKKYVKYEGQSRNKQFRDNRYENVSKKHSNRLPTCREEPEEEDAGKGRNKYNDQRTDYSDKEYVKYEGQSRNKQFQDTRYENKQRGEGNQQHGYYNQYHRPNYQSNRDQYHLDNTQSYDRCEPKKNEKYDKDQYQNYDYDQRGHRSRSGSRNQYDARHDRRDYNQDSNYAKRR